MNEVEKEITGKVKARLTLRKDEKLRHRSLVDPLFKEGKSVYDFPLRMAWRILTPDELEKSFRGGVPEKIGKLQMLITVPKKKRRHAVDRVLMRRRIREAYRLNRKEFLEEINASPNIGTLSMAFVYIHNENLPFDTIQRKMRSLLRKVAKGAAASLTPSLSSSHEEPDNK